MKKNWMIRAEGGALIEMFLTKEVVSIGWSEVGNISEFDKETLLNKLVDIYPNASIGKHRNTRSVLFRFCNRIQIDDNVVTYDPAKRIYHVGTILSEYNFDLSETIQENNAHIFKANEMGFIKGERTQIKQLFQNLIANGIKYKKENIEPRIKISSVRKENRLYVEIEDNGIGIQEDYLSQIFEMFRRLHTKEEYSGSGIGLSVCKKIVELYNGEIDVKSVYGEGSTFYFNILLES
jgi:light-regulated signal transduction histidine kinase (bacteriophytochrome)